MNDHPEKADTGGTASDMAYDPNSIDIIRVKFSDDIQELT